MRNTGATLGVPERGHFYGANTVFDLSIGAEYPVLGLGIWETVLLALVSDETGKPNWLPVGLFEFNSENVPADWEFALLDGLAASAGDASNRWVARLGYPELVRNPSHSDELIERNPAALRIFFRELAETSEKRG